MSALPPKADICGAIGYVRSRTSMQPKEDAQQSSGDVRPDDPRDKRKSDRR
jgi:hypothetical protein